MTYQERTKAFVLTHASLREYEQLEQFVNLLVLASKSQNLTSWSGDVLWERGIYYSLVALHAAWGAKPSGKWLDIGSGAGFPALPYLIVFPKGKLTLTEPRRLRANFLLSVIAELKLTNCQVHIGRAETINSKFERISAQAVGSLSELLTLVEKFLLPKTKLALIKGPRLDEELVAAKPLIKTLKIKPQVLLLKSPEITQDLRVFTT